MCKAIVDVLYKIIYVVFILMVYGSQCGIIIIQKNIYM